MSSFSAGPTFRIGTIAIQGKVGTDVRLGTPTDGDGTDGLVNLDPNASVTDVIDTLNEAAKGVDDKEGDAIAVGAPLDGDYTDGREPILPTTAIADAVDLLNIGLKAVDDSIIAMLDRVGWTRIVDVTNKATTPAAVYVDPPNNTILQAVSVTSNDFDVIVEAAFPKVEVNGTPATLPLTGSVYRGAVSISLPLNGDVVVESFDPDGNSAAQDTIAVTLDLPPAILTGIFTGGKPGSQSELKENDAIQIQIAADKNFDQVTILDVDAGKASVIAVAANTSATVALIIADRGTAPQALGARVQVRDAVTGGMSAAFDTDSAGAVEDVNVVTLNNLFPTLTLGTPTGFPGGQQALKGSESAAVPVTAASNADTIDWTSGPGHLSIVNANETPAFDASKSVSRIGGSYNVATDGGINNLTGTANRAANDATTVANSIINIANVAATVTVSEATTRVRSGVAPGNDTTITISADQELLSAPSLDPTASRGTFQGAGFIGGPKTWTRALRVIDSENPSTGAAQNWLNLSSTNLASIATTAITGNDTYVIGGFTPRTLNYAAFTADSTETLPLTDESKLQAGQFSNGNASVIQPFGTSDTTDVGKEGWAAPTAASGTAVQLRMLHTPSVSANSGGLTLPSVEETV